MDDTTGEDSTTEIGRQFFLDCFWVQSRQCYDNLDLVGHNIVPHIFHLREYSQFTELRDQSVVFGKR